MQGEHSTSSHLGPEEVAQVKSFLAAQETASRFVASFQRLLRLPGSVIQVPPELIGAEDAQPAEPATAPSAQAVEAGHAAG